MIIDYHPPRLRDIVVYLGYPGKKQSSGSGPELVDPEIEVQEPVCSHRIDPACALVGDGHQFAIEKRLEMLRNGRPADRQALCQFIDRTRLAAQFFEKKTPVGIRDGLESIHGHGCKLIKSFQPGKSFVCAATVLYFLDFRFFVEANI
jgi:hypothetical protein